jgi:NADH-quinone oxidoreductase subunit M
VILAGVLLKLGAYGLIRFAVPLFPFAAHTFAWPIIVLSVVAIVYGAIVSIVQTDLKRLVAYSSVSHMGFVTLGIFTFSAASYQGAVLQMISHGLITGGLFLLVGVIYERTHDRTIARMGGVAAVMPIYATVFGFFILASAGLPGLSGFVGEFLVFVGSFGVAPAITVASIIVMVLAATYLLWMFQRLAFGELSEFFRGLGGHLTDLDRTELITLAPLAFLIVLLGLFPSLVLDLLRAPTQVFLAAVGVAVAG